MIVLGIAGIRYAFTRRRFTRPLWVWLLGAALLIATVAPQLILYNGGGGFAVGRYLLPIGIAIAGAVAAGITSTRAHVSRSLALVASSAWIVVILASLLVTWHDAEGFRADSAQLARAVTTIDALPRDSTVA